MNLMDIDTRKWDQELLEFCGGKDLVTKLGGEPAEVGAASGRIGKWWQGRYGFSSGEQWCSGAAHAS